MLDQAKDENSGDKCSQDEKAASPLSKEIYLVHYNGFVFGANFSKIIIIREREANKEVTDESDLSEDDSS